MTDHNADFAMKYRVTFVVEVTDPVPLLKKAREMAAELQAIEDMLTASARQADPDAEDYEPEGIASIEEALCWVLPDGDEAQTFEILNAEAVAIRESPG
jgi:hypothetical protein